ncbi:TetR/AcrR family transcriptional regulator [Fodinicola acaciae]|uniref:TetR/AcrR family transcriptional regulator n=1 Tax=Fodinicola acaciae TaxID=2681555 RepID=UPI0013D5B27C|nr:TetR/AcrR family transcriptional regulator [Fodinicola acaciae]
MQEISRRERKKRQTRTTIGDTALRLFLERGFDAVSIKEIADEADVAVTTIFKHFPSKEALIFDEDADIEAGLVSAVRDRAPGQSVLDGLRDHIIASSHPESAEMRAFLRLIDETPALRDYGHRMWMRHETALAQAIAEETGAASDDIKPAALAHFALETRAVVRDRADREQALKDAFELLAIGADAAFLQR